MDTVDVSSAEQLRQVVSGNFAPVDFAGIRPRFAGGRLTAQDFGGGVRLMGASSTPVEQSPRIQLNAKATTSDLVFFGVHTVGLAYVRQHDRVAEVAPGTGVLYEAQHNFDLAFPTDMRSLTLVLPREMLPVRSSVISDRCARSITQHSASSRLLCGYLKQLTELADGLSVDQRLDAGQVAVDLLAMALRDLRPAVPQAGAVVLLEMMRTYVREHLSDPKLTVAELARRHHVSTRYTHILFEQIDTTPAAFIRDTRLRAAQAMLSDPTHAGKAVADIAAAAGFTELRTMERAFRARYGVAPGQWRRLGRENVQ